MAWRRNGLEETEEPLDSGLAILARRWAHCHCWFLRPPYLLPLVDRDLRRCANDNAKMPTPPGICCGKEDLLKNAQKKKDPAQKWYHTIPNIIHSKVQEVTIKFHDSRVLEKRIFCGAHLQHYITI